MKICLLLIIGLLFVACGSKSDTETSKEPVENPKVTTPPIGSASSFTLKGGTK